MKAHKYEIWKDNNSPVTRYVQVTRDADQQGRVEITTIFRSEGKYSLPAVIENGMVTHPRADRFHGMSGGYSYMAKNLKEFNARKIRLIQFAERLAKRKNNLKETIKHDLGTLSVSALPPAGPVMGEVWREIKGNCVRYVQIVGKPSEGRVQLITRYFTKTPGARPQASTGAMPSEAQEARFKGKPGGYEYVCKNLIELSASGLLNKRFIPAGQTYNSVLAGVLPVLEKGQIWHDLTKSHCFHLVQIVSVGEDTVEVTTSYVSGQGSEESNAPQLMVGKSEIISTEQFALDLKQYTLVNAA
ncbi:MAG: hypothetical protein RSD49_08000 [Hafnia sp.]